MKYSRSNSGNQQDDLQGKIAKKGGKTQKHVSGGFFMFGFLVTTLILSMHIIEKRLDDPIEIIIYIHLVIYWRKNVCKGDFQYLKQKSV